MTAAIFKKKFWPTCQVICVLWNTLFNYIFCVVRRQTVLLSFLDVFSPLTLPISLFSILFFQLGLSLSLISRTAHFLALNPIFQSWFCSIKLFRLLCNSLQQFLLTIHLMITALSTNMFMWLFNPSGKSFTLIKNIIGARTDLWGIPLLAMWGGENCKWLKWIMQKSWDVKNTLMLST